MDPNPYQSPKENEQLPGWRWYHWLAIAVVIVGGLGIAGTVLDPLRTDYEEANKASRSKQLNRIRVEPQSEPELSLDEGAFS